MKSIDCIIFFTMIHMCALHPASTALNYKVSMLKLYRHASRKLEHVYMTDFSAECDAKSVGREAETGSLWNNGQRTLWTATR